MPLPSIEPGQRSLDDRIAAAESRLVAREQRLRDGTELLLRRLQRATEPRRLMWPVVAGVLTLAAVAWGWRRLFRARPAGGSDLRASVVERGVAPSRRDLPWMRAIALAWPLLPAPWRMRVGPGAASWLAAVGLPLVEQLIKRAAPAPLPSVQGVDPVRLAGTWHQIAHRPSMFGARRGGWRSITCTLQGSTFEIVRRGVGTASRERRDPRVSHCSARLLPGSGGGRFELSAWPVWLRGLPFAWAERCIVQLDGDHSVALLGSPQRDHLSIWSRQPELPPQVLHALVERARELGFAVERLRCVGAA